MGDLIPSLFKVYEILTGVYLPYRLGPNIAKFLPQVRCSSRCLYRIASRSRASTVRLI